MADLSQLVQYENAYPVHLKFMGEPVGITMHIVSFDSDRVIKAGNAVGAKRWAAIFESEEKKLSHEQISEFADMEEREKLVAAITSWDFGGNSFGDIAADPECNEKNKRYVLGHANAKWIRDQLNNAGTDLGNFTQASAKPSKKK